MKGENGPLYKHDRKWEWRNWKKKWEIDNWGKSKTSPSDGNVENGEKG